MMSTVRHGGGPNMHYQATVSTAEQTSGMLFLNDDNDGHHHHLVGFGDTT